MQECDVMVNMSFEMMTLVLLSSAGQQPLHLATLCWGRFAFVGAFLAVPQVITVNLSSPHVVTLSFLQCQNFSTFKLDAISLDFGIKSWISLDCSTFDSPLIYLVNFCPTLIISTHCDFWQEKFWWTSKVSIELILSRPLVSPNPPLGNPTWLGIGWKKGNCGTRRGCKKLLPQNWLLKLGIY